VVLLANIEAEYLAAFGPESILPVANTPYGTLACMVHKEMLLPEAVRVVAGRGADLVLHPSAQRSDQPDPPHRALMQAHAYTNQLYWASAGLSTETLQTDSGADVFTFAGGSCVIGPDGSVLASAAGSDPGVTEADLDPEELQRVRNRERPATRPTEALQRAVASAAERGPREAKQRTAEKETA
jgi:predicted amidohydrolase